MKKALFAGALAALSMAGMVGTAGAAPAAPAGHLTSTTGTIRGTLTTSGTPLAGQCVTAFDVNGNGYNSAAATTSSGTYVIHNVPPGLYAVQYNQCTSNGNLDDGYWVPGYYKKVRGLDRDMATAVTVSAGKTTVVSDSVELGGGIVVDVVDTNGNPVNGAIICPNFINVQNQNGFCAFTDTTGSVTLTGVPTGPNRIGAYGNNTQEFYGNTTAFWASQTVNITAQTISPAITIVVPVASGPNRGAGTHAPKVATRPQLSPRS